MNSIMSDRTQTQFDSSPELKKQIKLLMIQENIPSQAILFLDALDVQWGKKYPDLRAAIQAEIKPRVR